MMNSSIFSNSKHEKRLKSSERQGRQTFKDINEFQTLEKKKQENKSDLWETTLNKFELNILERIFRVVRKLN